MSPSGHSSSPSMTTQSMSGSVSRLRMEKLGVDGAVFGIFTMPNLKMSVLPPISRKETLPLRKYWVTCSRKIHLHAWIVPLLIIAIVCGAYLSSDNRTKASAFQMFITISYKFGSSNIYGKGIRDLCFIFFYAIFFTFLREFVMDMVARPLVLYLNVTSEHRVKRLMEQIYSMVYYSISGPFGIYIMYHSDMWFFKTTPMYSTYPDLTNISYFKVYYLVQAAFWTHQACILVLQLEKPRKDHKQLVFHHVVTLLLILISYCFHFTKIGLLVYITMDVSDFFLSLSMTLNYLDSLLVPFALFTFAATWIYLRHIVNIRILWSILTEFSTEGGYVLNLATQQYKCWMTLIMVFVPLLALQLVNIYWLFLILRLLRRYIWKGIQKDDRSDTEYNEVDDSPDGLMEEKLPVSRENLKKKNAEICQI